MEQILALSFFALVLFFPSSVKPFVDTFAYGTSYARVYGVALYALALAFYPPLLQLLIQQKRKLPAFLQNLAFFACHLEKKATPGLLIAAIAATFAYGMLGHYMFVSQINGDFNEKYYIFDQRGFTSTHLNHNHALKTLFCFAVPSDDIDCARPMLNYLPHYYPKIGLLLFFFSFAAALICYSKMETASEKIAYVILTFASIKVSVDGGALNFENLAFLMLIPFLLVEKNRLVWTVVGVLVWLPIAYSTYEFYKPHELALPFIAFFYSISVFAINPKLFFPILAVAWVSPNYLITESQVVLDRWFPEPCMNAKLIEGYWVSTGGRLYSDCQAKKEFECGTVETFGNQVTYFGKSVKKPELMISKGLASNCTSGVFSIKWSYGSLKIIEGGAIN
ncbi:MAG: hypothetical protein QW275_02050 [Candidatus Anstonellaceae archaeon]